MMKTFIYKHPYTFMVGGTALFSVVVFCIVYGLLCFCKCEEGIALTWAETLCGIIGTVYFGSAGIYLMRLK